HPWPRQAAEDAVVHRAHRFDRGLGSEIMNQSPQRLGDRPGLGPRPQDDILGAGRSRTLPQQAVDLGLDPFAQTAALHVLDDAHDLEARVAVAHETPDVIANRALGQVLPGEGVIAKYDLRRRWRVFVGTEVATGDQPQPECPDVVGRDDGPDGVDVDGG